MPAPETKQADSATSRHNERLCVVVLDVGTAKDENGAGENDD